MAWNVAAPQETDLWRNFPALARADKTELKNWFSAEHDILGDGTGKHKSITLTATGGGSFLKFPFKSGQTDKVYAIHNQGDANFVVYLDNTPQFWVYGGGNRNFGTNLVIAPPGVFNCNTAGGRLVLPRNW